MSNVLVLTLLAPFDLLDLVHGALEDVALVWLDIEAGDVAHVGRQELGQLVYVTTLQLPPTLLHTARTATHTHSLGLFLRNVQNLILWRVSCNQMNPPSQHKG